MRHAPPRPAADSAVAGPGRGSVLLVLSGAILVGVVLIVLGSTSTNDQPGLRVALAAWITIPYIVAGLIAWRRRPESRLGVLMVGAGFGTSINFLMSSSNDLLFTLGVIGDALPPVLFLHVFLAFPTGRLPFRAERIVVAAAYVAASLTILR